MENNFLSAVKTDESSIWYTEEFIGVSIVNFLKDTGYKIHKDIAAKDNEKHEKVITASKFFTKEIIGIKGFSSGNKRSSLLAVADKHTASQHSKTWFAESLFNSFVNFGKYYSDESAVMAMALPDVERYKAIISKVEDYFTLNDLSFKIYLVSEKGEVEISNLNVKLSNELHTNHTKV